MFKNEEGIMKESLDNILDNVVLLANQFGLKDEIDKFTLMNILISYGYLSKDKTYKYSEDILYRDLYDDIIFELGIVPITGEGCCRHTTSLAKLILDRFNIENEVAASLITDKRIEPLKLLQLSELAGQALECNHAVNVVKIGDGHMAFDIEFDGLAHLYSINNNLLTSFFQRENLNSSYFIYNYSPFFNDRREFDKITSLSKSEQEDIIRSCNNIALVVKSNIDLVEEFYLESKPYMDRIDDSYQKILKK